MSLREHIGLIRPSDSGLVLHTLYYPNELHKANKAEAPKAKYSAKELELAKSLVTQLAAPFKPEQFEDSYRKQVERLIAQKRKGQKITTVEQPRKAPVVDLMKPSGEASTPARRQNRQPRAPDAGRERPGKPPDGKRPPPRPAPCPLSAPYRPLIGYRRKRKLSSLNGCCRPFQLPPQRSASNQESFVP